MNYVKQDVPNLMNNGVKTMRSKNIFCIFCIVFMLTCSLGLNAATYYVSTTGNDSSGTGTISNPWKTITKGQSMLDAGDTLLVRGGTYYESVTITVQGTQSGRITIKAYPGETPVLDGRSIITGWTRCAANEPGLTVAGKTNVNATSIYKANIDTSEFTTSGLWWMLYEDGKHSFQCRWPEQSEGYGVDPTEFQDVPTESVDTTASIIDNTVLNRTNSSSIWYPYINGLSATQLASYWNDSSIQIWFKSGANATGSYSITGYANNEITTDTLRRALLTDDKYCFYRHPHLVNAPGKFYYSSTAVNGYQTFYLWPKNTANLASKISIPTRSKGFYASNKDYITIDGFKVVGFQDVGIHFINATSTSPIVKNCTVEDCGESGIYIQNTAEAVVDTCTVNRVGDRGIFINGGTNCIIKNSTAKDNRGTCISMYNVQNGQITDNTIYDARGVHVNGVSCYMGCNKMLIARNRFAPAVNLAMQNIADVCLFGNIMDGGGEKANILSTWVDTTNSNQATRGYQVYLQNTLINASTPYSMIDFCSKSGSFTDATIDNNGGKVRLNAAGCFTSTQFKYSGTYGLMIYCDFSNSTYADGWYESIANTADTCTIDLAYVSSTPTASGQCGGQSANYLYNNLIGGCGEWEKNMLGRSHNWWIPKTYGSSYATPNPPLTGEIYTSYSDRVTAMNSCFTDYANQNYTLKTGSSAIGAGMPLAAINAILDDTTIGDSGTSIRQNFPNFDFMKDIAGRTWAATPSMGANEYTSGGSTPISYALTITSTNGTVNKKVAGITTTATSFPAGTVVELTAAANSGYTFSSWSGSATGTTNPVSVTMSANKSVTANFTQNTTTYTLSTTATSGTVTKKVAGVTTTATSFPSGTVVELTAAANSGYSFGSWSGSVTGTTNPVSVTMNANKSVTANFAQSTTTYTLSITATSGTVTKKVAGVTTTATSFAAGTVVELTATTISGYTFSSWSGSATGTANPVSVTMNANKTVTANFTQIPADIIIDNLDTATDSTGTWPVSGGADPYGSDSVYARNPELSFSWLFTPAESGNYEVSMWWTEYASRSTAAPVEIQTASGTVPLTVNQQTNGGVWNVLGQYSFSAGTTYRVTIRTKMDDTTISADAIRFVKKQDITTYTLSVMATNGTVAKSPNTATYTYGQVVTLTATANTGYSFGSWAGGATGTTNPVTVTMNGNKSVTANFTQNTYTLAIAATNGSVAKSPNTAAYTYGQVVTLTATPNAGYSFGSWTGSATGITNPVTVTINGNKAVTANFTALPMAACVTAHWMLNENTGTTVTDSTSAGRTAALINSPSWGYAWANEDWVSMANQTQAIAIPAAALNPQAGSVAVWVEPDSVTGTQFILGHIFNGGNRICLYSVAGKLALGLGSTAILKTNIADLTIGQTVHIALTWSGTTYAVYVNAVQKTTGTFEGLTALNTTLDVGNYGDPASRTLGFVGVIEDIRTYCRALTALEIQRLYDTYDVHQQKPITFSLPGVYQSTSLPAGAKFQNGVFTWQPWYNQAGNYTVVFTATGQPVRVVTITVHNAPLTDWYSQFLVHKGKLQ
jgi:uncharacterized repeat protein (TIGR02543 family)